MLGVSHNKTVPYLGLQRPLEVTDIGYVVAIVGPFIGDTKLEVSDFRVSTNRIDYLEKRIHVDPIYDPF